IPLPNSAPLRIRTTPPHVIHALAFLLSAAAKRDAAGRKPKKGVFARAGLELAVLADVGKGRGKDDETLARIKADLYCELISIETQRSSFPSSLSALHTLTSLLRSCTPSLWESYAPRVTLLWAQLAHARGDIAEARRGYDVAAFLGARGKKGVDEWVACAGRAGGVWVRIGVLRREGFSGSGSGASGEREREQEWEWENLRKEGKEVVRECKGRGAALNAVGEMLEACLGVELVAAKQHLHTALSLCTKAGDNHLRALILALSAAHYLHTARDHARTMLGVCGGLAAGLGALPKPDGGGKGERGGWNGGNAPLALWVGERTVELYRAEGEEGDARRQEGWCGVVRGVVREWGAV
ncbi:hypothetical protein DXG01_010315, partial [Tephrocybe rancida]